MEIYYCDPFFKQGPSAPLCKRDATVDARAIRAPTCSPLFSLGAWMVADTVAPTARDSPAAKRLIVW